MSRLQELIRELCPDGVEYVTLDESCYYPRERMSIDDLDEGAYVSVENLAQDFGGLTGEVATTKPGTAVICFREGDVLVGNIRPYLKKVWLADFDGGTNGDVLVFRIKDSYGERLLPEFVCMQLASESFIDFDMKYAKGAKMPRGDKKAVLRYRIPVPPIEVQREVVRILDEYTAAHDELVRQLEEEMYLRERQHRDMRQALFDNCTGDIVTIGELFPFIRNGFVGTVSNHFSDREDGIRYLEGTNVHDGHISDNEEIYVTHDFHEAHLRSELKPTDIVVVQSGHVGECAVVGDNYAGGNCHALIVMSNGGRCDSQYVVQYLYSAEGKRQIDKMTTGGTVKHILASKIGRIRLPLPSETRQHEIVAIIGEMDRSYRELINSLQEELNSHILQLALVRNQLLSFPEKVA